MNTWLARQMVSGNWDIADEETGKTIARTETEENARLIEAAPEMLAMLKAVNYAFYVKGTRKELQKALEGSRELIRKAEGRTE